MNLPDFQLPVPTNPPDAGSIIGVIFGADWIPIILSALELLRFEELWLSPPTDLIPQIDELMERIANPVIIQPQIYPERILHFHKFSEVVTGNGLILVNSTLFDFASAWMQSAAAQYDQFKFKVFLQAGSWVMSFYGSKSNVSPILTVLTDESETFTLDLYNASLLQNQKVSSILTVHSSGNHWIFVQAATRHTSSTGWNVVLTSVGFDK